LASNGCTRLQTDVNPTELKPACVVVGMQPSVMHSCSHILQWLSWAAPGSKDNELNCARCARIHAPAPRTHACQVEADGAGVSASRTVSSLAPASSNPHLLSCTSIVQWLYLAVHGCEATPSCDGPICACTQHAAPSTQHPAPSTQMTQCCASTQRHPQCRTPYPPPLRPPHAGHARVYVAFDVLYRLLRHLRYEVQYVRNFTDIDDKIINRAREGGEDPLALSQRFINEFRCGAWTLLGCLWPDSCESPFPLRKSLDTVWASHVGNCGKKVSMMELGRRRNDERSSSTSAGSKPVHDAPAGFVYRWYD
jgi:hypothetical protein